MRKSLAILAFATITLAGTQGSAVGLMFQMDRLGITNEDFRIIREESARLYETGPVEVGAETVWMNPETGAHGKIEVTEFDGRCVVLEHVFRSGTSPDVHRLETRRCRGTDNVWRLAPE